jgi:hypothetical protein
MVVKEEGLDGQDAAGALFLIAPKWLAIACM